MTEPAPDGPYDNSIRADSPSGLRGLWRVLTDIATGLGALPALLAAVQQIRDDVRYLRGNPETVVSGWDGLAVSIGGLPSGYSELTLAATDFVYDKGSRMEQNLQQSRGLLSELREAIGLLASQPVGERVNLVNRARIMQVELTALADALGRLLDAPAGETVKALLADISGHTLRSAECCEEGGGTNPPDPDNPLNDPPVNFGCPNAIRATSWVNRGTVQVGGSDRHLWQARFDSLPPGIEQYEVAISDATSYGLAAPATKYDLCVSWNFNNNATQPDAIGRNRSNLQDTAATDLATGGVPSPGDFVTGGFVDELSTCDDPDPDNDWCGYIFRTVSSTPPALNVWIASIERTCAA